MPGGNRCMSSGENDHVIAGDALLIIKCIWCFVCQQLGNKLSPEQNKTWQRTQLNISFEYPQSVSPTSSQPTYTQFHQVYLHWLLSYSTPHKQSDWKVPKANTLSSQSPSKLLFIKPFFIITGKQPKTILHMWTQRNYCLSPNCAAPIHLQSFVLTHREYLMTVWEILLKSIC